MDGYIKLSRALKYWRYKKKPNYVALWIHMLQEAYFKDGYFGTVQVKRGQFVTSYQKLADETGLTVRQVRSIIGNLVGEELSVKTTNKYSLITILKYDEYQGSDEKSDKQNDKQVTSNRQANDNYIRKKESKKERIDILPTYDTSLNKVMSEEEEMELLELMKGEA